jgi:anti-anti-sigma factor
MRADWGRMADAGALTIKAVHDGRICALTLNGALDLTTAAEFLEHVARAVDDRTERFVLDLAGLAFLDCAGARALVMATYAAPSGCPVIVRSVSPPAARLIDLLNLDLRHLWQEPSAGLEDYGTAGTAGATSRSHSAERPHTLNRAGRNLWRVQSPEASHRHAPGV